MTGYPIEDSLGTIKINPNPLKSLLLCRMEKSSPLKPLCAVFPLLYNTVLTTNVFPDLYSLYPVLDIYFIGGRWLKI